MSVKLKDEVCSFKLAKKLNQLGVKQDSLLYWISGEIDGKWCLRYYLDFSHHHHPGRISAFTVGELGRMLPEYITSLSGKDGKFQAGWHPGRYSFVGFDGRFLKEADTRAKIMIYIIENGIINKDNKIFA